MPCASRSPRRPTIALNKVAGAVNPRLPTGLSSWDDIGARAVTDDNNAPIAWSGRQQARELPGLGLSEEKLFRLQNQLTQAADKRR